MSAGAGDFTRESPIAGNLGVSQNGILLCTQGLDGTILGYGDVQCSEPKALNNVQGSAFCA